MLLNQVRFWHPLEDDNWTILFLCPDRTSDALTHDEFRICQPEILLESPPPSEEIGLPAGGTPTCAWCDWGELLVEFYADEEAR